MSCYCDSISMANLFSRESRLLRSNPLQPRLEDLGSPFIDTTT